MNRMCFLTEQEVKRDGEDEFKIWYVTDKKNVYILKTGQPGVGMAFKWKVASSMLEALRRGQTFRGSCIHQTGKKGPTTDCLQGGGTEI